MISGIVHSPKEQLRVLLPKLNAAHYTNILMRINGKNVSIEADWLKDLAKEMFPDWRPGDE